MGRIKNLDSRGGVNPLSRNFNWSLSLVGLPGRAGLDMGLSLSYNSLVWTQSGPYAYFDAANGFPSPGFRLGFPVIQERTYNAEADALMYLLLTPNGGRVELRRNGDVYETVDGSYLQLTEGSTNLWLRTTDGTQLTYTKVQNEWRCTQVKDRNGNYLTVTYYWWGQINQITDTLGRVLTFNYDNDQKLTTITQPWGNATHQWAAFEYQELSLSVPNGSQAIGAKNGQQWPVLQRVTLADGGYYAFRYEAQGQVSTITRWAADDHELNQVVYALTGGPLADRVIQEQVTAQDWLGGNMVSVTYGAPAPATWQRPYDNAPQSGLRSIITTPDGVESRLYFGATGWQRGLGLFTETVANEQVRRWTTTAWETEAGGVNPRVTETNVGDPQGNRRRTTIGYTSYGLPADVREYTGPNSATLYRTSHTDYLLTGPYTAPGPDYGRIIGLPAASYACDGTVGTNPCSSDSGAALISKVTYKYDEPTWPEHLEDTPAAAVQHDRTHYGAGFIVGRGNLYSTVRWDVSQPNTASAAVESKAGYYVTGTPRFTRANGPNNNWEQVFFDYADKFSDGSSTPVNYNTFAYPTQVTDPDGFTAQSEYRYDFGAVVKSSGPPPAGQSQGAIVRRQYDAIGRLEKVRTEFNGNPDYSYTRWTYSAAQNSVNQFTTLTAGAGEAYSFSMSDGAGRTRYRVTEHPGSTGGYSTTATEYDALGRAFRQSVPTETDANTTPTGDDVAGYLYQEQTFDWKGRPLVTTNTDGTQTEASYGGCGCAGGAVVTLTGEQLAQGRRRQKVYADNLGRTYKTEVLNYNHTESVPDIYATTVTEYNARDQVRFVKQYAGAATSDGSCPTGSCQQSETQYDGHGRTWRTHTPEMDAGAWQSVAYHTNDTVTSTTDPRGATANYTYNGRRLVTQISYTSPDTATIPLPATANFLYDAAGNRTSMNDGLGSVLYEYNQLNQLTTETRQFTDSLPQAPLSGNRFSLTYTYGLGGQLASLTDPFGQQITYGQDKTGRLTNVTGSAFGGVTNYAQNAQYRAWGGLKHLNYGNGGQVNLTFNSKLQAQSYTLTAGGSNLIQKNFQYYEDGQLRYAQDELNAKFDRAYQYDFLGRMSTAKTGAEARGQTETNGDNRPYRYSYGYDAFGHVTGRSSLHWTQNVSSAAIYQNNRNTALPHDAAGQPLSADDGANGLLYVYDAARQIQQATAIENNRTVTGYDGQGQAVKQVKTDFNETTNQYTTPNNTVYFIRSSVLGGQVISEARVTGAQDKSYLYAGGSVLAIQQKSGVYQGDVDYVRWEHREPSQGSVRYTVANGQPEGAAAQELDANGADVQLFNPYLEIINPPPDEWGGSSLAYPYAGSPQHQRTSYSINGIPISEEYFLMSIDSPLLNQFGLWEMSARASRSGFRDYTVFDRKGNLVEQTRNLNRAIGVAIEEETYEVTRNWLVNDSWTFAATLIPLGQETKNLYLVYDTKLFLYPDKGNLKKDVTNRLNNGDCRNRINALLMSLGLKKNANIDAIVEKYFSRKDGVLLSSGVTATGEYLSQTGEYSNNRIILSALAPANSVAGVFIHELLHGAKGGSPFSHEQIFKAIAKLDGFDQDFKNFKERAKKAKLKLPEDGYYSNKMNAWLGMNCGSDEDRVKWKKAWEQYLQSISTP